MINANDLKSKTTDFNNLWQEIVHDIHYLETFGVKIKSKPNLKGTLTESSFDNLGANFALGYVMCFIASHFCRHCISSKEQCQTEVKEDRALLRTKQRYDDHCQIIQNSEKVDFSMTKGMKIYCKLNDITHFHILDNPSVDIMHDLAEGVIPFLLKNLFVYAFNKSIFDEVELDWMVQYHDYGWLSRRNLPSRVSISKRRVGQSAAQVLCLFKHLPMLLYKYKENENLKLVWPCVTSLLRIVEIVHAYELNDDHLCILNKEISNHLTYTKSAFDTHSRPKHHFMTHYASTVRKMGPLIYLSMMRYEAKHQQIKRLLGEDRNFQNINKTLANKHQKMMWYSKFTYKDDIETAKIEPATATECNHSQLNQDDLRKTKRAFINNYEYMPGLLFIHKSFLYQIKNVLIAEENYILIGKTCKVKNFNTFLNCFEIELDESSIEISVNVNDLSIKKTFEKKIVDQKMYTMAAIIDLKKEDVWK